MGPTGRASCVRETTLAFVGLWGTVAGRRMSSKDICVLILGTMNTNTMLYKRRHSTDMIKVKDFEDGRLTQIMQMDPI